MNNEFKLPGSNYFRLSCHVYQKPIKNMHYAWKSIHVDTFKSFNDAKLGILSFTWQVKVAKFRNISFSIVRESHLSHFRKLFYTAVKKPAILFSTGSTCH